MHRITKLLIGGSIVLLVGNVIGMKLAQCEPSPLPSRTPKPFYLPLDEVVPKSLREKAKKARSIKMQSDLGNDRVIDHRAFDSKIIEQYRGDCTAQGLAAAGEVILKRNGFKPDDEISQESLWARYKTPSAEVAVDAWQANFVKREAAWPFGYAKWIEPEEKSRYRLSEIEYLGADGEAAFQAIEQGFPIYAAMSVSQGMASCFAEIGPNSKPTSGGHAMLFSGARVKDGKISFLVKQQWGTDCGDAGYQWLPLSTCDQTDAYCLFWIVKKIEDKITGKTYGVNAVNPIPNPKPSAAPSSAPSEELKVTIAGVDFSCKKTSK